MTIFRVWAPHARSVTLAIVGPPANAAEVPMTPRGGGWWFAETESHPEVVLDYGFRLDGGEIRPDPRSRRQPSGVHRPSRTFDTSAYSWTDAGWSGLPLDRAVIYEMHVGTMTAAGTLDAAVDKLDHLLDLGINTVELLPVNAFNGPRNWGYDGVLWFAVHEEYGGPPAYQRFVDACHRRGIAVIQDVVYNHLGPSGNYLPEFGPYLRSDLSNTWGEAVNLDGPGSDEVRRYILDNAMMWFTDFHVDGLRLDAVHALRDSRALTLLEELATETAALADDLGRPLHLIAESDLNDPRLITPRSAGGVGLTAAWDDDVHHALHVAVTGETAGYYADFASPAALPKVMASGYFHDGSFSSFRGRSHGRPIDISHTPPWRLVAFVQDHDQVGNRAAGDRIAHQAGWRAQAVAAVLLLTAPFTPMLFMGEEWAASTPWPFFTSHPEADLAEKTRRGRFEEFSRHGWDVSRVPDPQAPSTFASAVLNWDEREHGPHAAMLRLYRQLLRLRREQVDITDVPWPDTRVEVTPAGDSVVIRRGAVTVVANLASTPRQLSLTPESPQDVFDLALSTDEAIERSGDGTSVIMPAMAAAVLTRSAR